MMDTADVDAVVRLAQGGDHAAFERLVDLIGRDVRIFIAVHACASDQVDEIHQATWVTVYETLSRYELRGTFVSWVKGIAKNLLKRDLALRARHAAADVSALQHLLLADALGHVDADADDDEQRQRQARHLDKCLEQLSPRARSLIERRHLHQVPLPLLAQQFKQNTSALAMTLLRIRRALRGCLESASP